MSSHHLDRMFCACHVDAVFDGRLTVSHDSFDVHTDKLFGSNITFGVFVVALWSSDRSFFDAASVTQQVAPSLPLNHSCARKRHLIRSQPGKP